MLFLFLEMIKADVNTPKALAIKSYGSNTLVVVMADCKSSRIVPKNSENATQMDNISFL